MLLLNLIWGSFILKSLMAYSGGINITYKTNTFLTSFVLLTCLILASSILADTNPVLNSGLENGTARTIEWSGFTWKVIPPHIGNPGNNYWSDSINNVWTDAQGRLHLKITNVGGIWYCAALETSTPVSYGTYSIVVASNPATLDNNAIAGLFYYMDDYNELDIEFSRWGDPNANNTQYSVQSIPTPIVSPLYETNSANTTHKMIWNVDRVRFEGPTGVGPWTYTGPYKTKTGSPYCINLWLMNGRPPTDGKEQELILSSFRSVGVVNYDLNGKE